MFPSLWVVQCQQYLCIKIRKPNECPKYDTKLLLMLRPQF